jgi:hypothetical protein
MDPVEGMWWGGIVAGLVLAGVAFPRSRVLAGFQVGTVTADAITKGIASKILQPTRAANGGAPFEGLVRVAFHVHQALFLAYPAALAVLCLVVLGPRDGAWRSGKGWRWVLAAYLVTFAALVAGYPTIRGPVLPWVYGLAETAVAVAVAVSIVSWWLRSEPTSLFELSVLVLGIVQAGALVAYVDPFGIGWLFAGIARSVAWAALVLVHVGVVLWERSSSSSSPRN